MGCDDDAHWQAETKKMGKKKIPPSNERMDGENEENIADGDRIFGLGQMEG